MAGVLARISFAVLSSLGAAVLASAQDAPDAHLDSLLQNSPFGRGPAAAKVANGAPLELRGVMVEGGTVYFSIYEASSARSTWVRQDDPSKQNFTVKSYDADNKRVTVQFQGSDLVLALASAPTVPVAPTANRPTVAPAGAANASAGSPAAESEAERLRKIAEEIKRRRALRQQAINNTQNNRP